MCPLCIASIAVGVTAKTGAGAAAIAVATRVAKSITRPANDASSHDERGSERGAR